MHVKDLIFPSKKLPGKFKSGLRQIHQIIPKLITSDGRKTVKVKPIPFHCSAGKQCKKEHWWSFWVNNTVMHNSLWQSQACPPKYFQNDSLLCTSKFPSMATIPSLSLLCSIHLCRLKPGNNSDAAQKNAGWDLCNHFKVEETHNSH